MMMMWLFSHRTSSYQNVFQYSTTFVLQCLRRYCSGNQQRQRVLFCWIPALLNVIALQTSRKLTVTHKKWNIDRAIGQFWKRLASGYVHRHECEYEFESGFRLRVVCHSYKLHPHEWSVRGHLYKHVTQRCLLTISIEIESSKCFAKKVTIFHYIFNNFTNRAPLIMNNLTMTIYDVKYASWPV